MADKTETAAVEEIVNKNKAPTMLSAISADSVMSFSDKSLIPLERFADLPRRIRACATLEDQASFSEYVKLHKIDGFTALFGRCSPIGGSFAAIIDYHSLGQPRWGDHRATLTLANTEEWSRWLDKDGVPMAQVAFAEFIEDNLADISAPAAADLLEVVQDLTAKKSVDFRSAMRLGNGQTSLLYDETILTSKRDGQIDVPSELTIVVAPFVGSAPTSITARLRFRITDGRLSFIYKLNRPSAVIKQAFDTARQYIEQATGLPVLFGQVTIPNPPSC